MDFHGEMNLQNCRLCLCKCETARNLLEDTDFADKIMEIFPKVVISPKNGLSTLICDYCHKTVQNFIGFYENVNANQDELMKMLPEIPNEEVFAEPIVSFEYKMQPSDLKMDENEAELAVNEPEETENVLLEPDLKPKLQNVTKTDYTKDELESLKLL
ncbi:uncharacterized protein LOC134828887 [Culicoides brevitarsis]|uniref:uncharacterized protein LOC134828887 n=1 Tax=Culicoides brevitarsis TaxID=469753 RepID=UPI00307B7D01